MKKLSVLKALCLTLLIIFTFLSYTHTIPDYQLYCDCEPTFEFDVYSIPTLPLCTPDNNLL